jgi:hypothetical protein
MFPISSTRLGSVLQGRQGKPVHVVELADLQIVALAVSHAKKDDVVKLVFRDNVLKYCLELVLKAQVISGVSVTNSSQLVQLLLSRKYA